jgi:hypothetical protein
MLLLVDHPPRQVTRGDAKNNAVGLTICVYPDTNSSSSVKVASLAISQSGMGSDTLVFSDAGVRIGAQIGAQSPIKIVPFVRERFHRHALLWPN